MGVKIDLEADPAIQAVPGNFNARLSLAAKRLFLPSPLMDLANQQALQTAEELHNYCTAFPGGVVMHMRWSPVDTFKALKGLQDTLIKGGVVADPARVKPYTPGLI